MDILKDIIRSLRNLSFPEDGEPVFPGCKTYPISDENFREISKRDGPVTFIDGGNAEILSAANFSLNFVRVYACTFENQRKIFSKRKEFYVLTSIGGEGMYRTEVFSDWIEMPEFRRDDVTIREGMFSPDASKIATITRRFSEWKLAAEIKDTTMIVMDGTLQTGVTGESDLANAAFTNATGNGVLFTGLAKTSSLVTTTGNDLLAVLKRRGPAKWMYSPIADIASDAHRADVCAIKLHEHSQHAFRFEILRDQKERLSEAVSMLAGNSNDYRFPGYPYGLVDADQFARISEKERIYLRSLFASLGLDESSGNAHDILNKISR